MFPQNCLGTPLRQTALKIIAAVAKLSLTISCLYNRCFWVPKRMARKALEKLGGFIATLIGRDTGNVVP
jgi:hypothetical protein